jgi:two-component system, OmpR family, sensor histidine kinase KdpD
VKTTVAKTLFRVAICGLVVVAIVYCFTHLVLVNPTTVALTFLMSVLVVSTAWGLYYALFLAVTATAAFNYYFLPPIGTFTIADRQNWVALFFFLATAVIASELSSRAQKQTDEAVRRRRELERLYHFSQQLLIADNILQLLNALPQHVIDAFGVSAAAIYVPGKGDLYRAGGENPELDVERLKSVIVRGETVVDSACDVSFTPLKMGVKIVGAIGVTGNLSPETLHAVGSLIGIAIERASAVESLSRNEAAREGERLRSAILDSVTHEFRTPLTSIKASITSLMSGISLTDADRQELMTVINEESDRLNRLVGEAAEVAQLDSHEFELRLQKHRIGDLVAEAVTELRQVLGKHPVEIRAPQDLTATLDGDRIKEVLTQLLENAAKYSPPEAPIRVTAETEDANLVVSVSDQGPGIEDLEQGLIFDKFYRGKHDRYRVQGTGMGLAIAKTIVEAHGGKIGVTSQPGCGSVFHFSLPMNR